MAVNSDYVKQNTDVIYYSKSPLESRGTVVHYSGLVAPYYKTPLTSPMLQERGISKSWFLNQIKLMLPYCNKLVSDSYIKDSGPTCNIFLLIRDVNTDRFMGFIMGYVKPNEEYYIDVICTSSGYGKHLIDFFINDAFERHAKSVGLSALPHVLSYYPRLGFKHVHECGEDPLVIPRLSKPPKDLIEAMGNDELADFMVELTNRGFSSRKTPECERLANRGELRAKSDCAIDGYYMKYCYPPQQQQQPPPPPPPQNNMRMLRLPNTRKRKESSNSGYSTNNVSSVNGHMMNTGNNMSSRRSKRARVTTQRYGS